MAVGNNVRTNERRSCDDVKHVAPHTGRVVLLVCAVCCFVFLCGFAAAALALNVVRCSTIHGMLVYVCAKAYVQKVW